MDSYPSWCIRRGVLSLALSSQDQCCRQKNPLVLEPERREAGLDIPGQADREDAMFAEKRLEVSRAMEVAVEVVWAWLADSNVAHDPPVQPDNYSSAKLLIEYLGKEIKTAEVRDRTTYCELRSGESPNNS